MIEEAEQQGILTKEKKIVEPSSGNTGIGIALVGTVKGYDTCILMPEKMSSEKEITIKCLGSEIMRTPSNVPSTHPKSHFNQARKIINRNPLTSILLDQYNNPENPNIHYSKTAEEIWSQCEGKIDCVVIGAGTCGTICGISKRLKELNPNIIVIGVDPLGSKLSLTREEEAMQDEAGGISYKIEGIGYDFIPNILKEYQIDHWERIGDGESFRMARELIRKEGILCGGSSGSVMVAAIRATKKYKFTSKHRLCVILPDGIRNYMSKFVNDDWMIINNFMDSDGGCGGNSSVNTSGNSSYTCDNAISNSDVWLRGKNVVGMNGKIKVNELLTLVKDNDDNDDNDFIPILNDNLEIIGVIDVRNLCRRVLNQNLDDDDQNIMNRNIEDFLIKEYHSSAYGDPLPILKRNIKTGYPCFIKGPFEIKSISMRTFLLWEMETTTLV